MAAKLFYTLEETAEKLSMSVDQVKQLAKDGQLQLFRDRDKLMFKVDQVDAKVAGGATAGDTSGGSIGAIPLADTDLGDTAGLDMSATDTSEMQSLQQDDSQKTSGARVFETGGDSAVDSTHVTGGEEEDLAIESVGSGSGLLDLTRESDDTSLGAELLDEIYPGGELSGTGTQMDTGLGTGIGSGSVFGKDIGVEAGAAEQGMMPLAMGAEAFDDAPWSGGSLGVLVGATVCLIMALVAVISAAVGAPSQLTATVGGNPLMWLGIMAGGCLVLFLVGFVFGKMQE